MSDTVYIRPPVPAQNDARRSLSFATRGRATSAKSVGSSLADLETAFDGVRYYSLAENKQSLQGDFATKTFADVLQAAKKAGILTKDVSAAEMIDPRFVAAAQ